MLLALSLTKVSVNKMYVLNPDVARLRILFISLTSSCNKSILTVKLSLLETFPPLRSTNSLMAPTPFCTVILAGTTELTFIVSENVNSKNGAPSMSKQ